MTREEWAAARAGWESLRFNEVGWRTVRVFISSTFTDFVGERDSLTRNVFPQLQELCLPLQIKVVPIDLRWGLTKEDTSDAGAFVVICFLLSVSFFPPTQNHACSVSAVSLPHFSLLLRPWCVGALPANCVGLSTVLHRSAWRALWLDPAALSNF